MLLSAPPWPSSTDAKLDQIMGHVLTLGREVDTLRADNVALDKKVISQGEAIERLKDTNTTIQSRVHTIEEENEDLRQAVDGVGQGACISVIAEIGYPKWSCEMWLCHVALVSHFVAG